PEVQNATACDGRHYLSHDLAYITIFIVITAYLEFIALYEISFKLMSRPVDRLQTVVQRPQRHVELLVDRQGLPEDVSDVRPRTDHRSGAPNLRVCIGQVGVNAGSNAREHRGAQCRGFLER